MTRERRLGRGLEALLGRRPDPDDPPIQVPERRHPEPPAEEAADTRHLSQRTAHQSADGAASHPDGQVPEPSGPSQVTVGPGGTVVLGVAQIDGNPFQPRQDFDADETRGLSQSLADHGLLQPLVVRRVDDRYQLIAGERRLRAAKEAGWEKVPVRVVEADQRQAAELALVENLQRKDLNPLEKAASFQQYLEVHGCTQEELASRLKLDRSTIANLIRLLELPGAVQDAIRRGRLTQGHARALLPLGDEDEQIAFCRRIQDEGLSVRDTEALVQEIIRQADEEDQPGETLGLIHPDGGRTPTRPPKSEHVAALEQEFRRALGARVQLTHKSRGRGKLVIHFKNHDEFQRIHRQICGEIAEEPHVKLG